MSIKDNLLLQIKDAMKAKNKPLLEALRFISAGIKQAEIDGQTTLGDEEVIAILTKMLKQRRDAEQQYRDANREELANKEASEAAIIQSFLPEQLSEAEIETMITDAIVAASAESMKDMGKVMGMLKPKLQGRADMGLVSKKLKTQLSS